jgi:hypothetical protein
VPVAPLPYRLAAVIPADPDKWELVILAMPKAVVDVETSTWLVVNAPVVVQNGVLFIAKTILPPVGAFRVVAVPVPIRL